MSLVAATRAAFARGQALANAAQAYVPREGQMQMALAIAQTIETDSVLVVEAGTGVGKTFAYLVPALLSGERVLLSTATKTLQDQLFGRDLPRLAQALGLGLRAALLKGRGSYLCAHRLELARHDSAATDRPLARTLASIETWAQSTRTGDLAELPGLDERSPVIPLVTSTRENCLGTQCPKLRDCHVNQARREALAADVVVVNHHLFFADLAVRESGMAELLPTVHTVIFDEAHQLNEIGVQFLGTRLGTTQVLDFARDLLGCGLQQAAGLADWHELAAAVEYAARGLRMLVGKSESGAKVNWVTRVPEGIDAQAWEHALGSLSEAVAQVQATLKQVEETGPDFQRLWQRAQEFSTQLDRFAQSCEPGKVRWLEVGTSVRLIESPLDIAQTMRARLFAAPGADEGDTPRAAKAWIFTSATLGDDERLSWFCEPCGLAQASVLRVASPFDYPNQAAIYVPRDIARPNSPEHSTQVAWFVAQAVGQLGGRTMVLTTTLRALRTVGDILTRHFEQSAQIEVLVQGTAPKRRLMERFRQGDGSDGRGCVLVASASFWEGIDVPGEALQLLIIDKLPFPPPNDPLVDARSRRLQSEERSPFKDYFLPEAAVALKQGAGRLIRSESDRGVLVVCDARLSAMSYGRRLLAALPPMRRLDSALAFAQALADLRQPGPVADHQIFHQGF